MDMEIAQSQRSLKLSMIRELSALQKKKIFGKSDHKNTNIKDGK
jgi:hypothetical protein